MTFISESYFATFSSMWEKLHPKLPVKRTGPEI
jgi:hypothetical protein